MEQRPITPLEPTGPQSQQSSEEQTTLSKKEFVGLALKVAALVSQTKPATTDNNTAEIGAGALEFEPSIPLQNVLAYLNNPNTIKTPAEQALLQKLTDLDEDAQRFAESLEAASRKLSTNPELIKKFQELMRSQASTPEGNRDIDSKLLQQAQDVLGSKFLEDLDKYSNNPQTTGLAKQVRSVKVSAPEEKGLMKQVRTVIGSFSGALSSAKAFGPEFMAFGKALLNTSLRKPDKEKYWEPVRDHGYKALGHFADFLRHTSVIALTGTAIAAVLGAMGTPIGLAIAGGTLITITGVGLAVRGVSIILKKISDKKAKNVKGLLTDFEEAVVNSEELEKINPKIKKNISNFADKAHKVLDQAQEIKNAYEEDKSPNKDPALFLMKHLQKNPDLITKTLRTFGQEEYAQRAEETIKNIERLKGLGEALSASYKDITCEKDKTNIIDPNALIIKIPKKIKSKFKGNSAQEFRELATQVATETIKQFKGEDNKIHTHLDSTAPTNQALHALMIANKALSPLTMGACGNPDTILRVLEVAKLTGVEVRLSERDQALFAASNPETSNKQKADFQAQQDDDTTVKNKTKPNPT